MIKHLIFLLIFLSNCISCSAGIRAIIFDCDGTLINNGSGYFLPWQYALAQQGYELTPEEFWQFANDHQLVGSPEAEKIILKYCCELLGRDCAADLHVDKKVYSAQLQKNHHFPPIEPTVKFLHQLAQEKDRLGLKIGLASGGTKENILRILKRLNIEGYFDIIVSGSDDLSHFSDSEGTNKPKPYVYLHAAALLGISPEECVAIEDSRTGVSSAVDAQCITVAIPNEYTKHQNLSQAHLHMASFDGITPESFLQMIENLQINSFK